MNHIGEAIFSACKAAPAWFGVYIAHVTANITVSGVAAVAATVYSVVQTYISIQRYRGGK